MKSDKALFVILTTVTLDAAGIGLIMPVLPGLLRAGRRRSGRPPLRRAAGAVCADAVPVRAAAGRAVRQPRTPSGAAGLAGRRRAGLRGDGGRAGAVGAVPGPRRRRPDRRDRRGRQLLHRRPLARRGPRPPLRLPERLHGPGADRRAGHRRPGGPVVTACALRRRRRAERAQLPHGLALPAGIAARARRHDIGRNSPRRRWHPRGSRAPGAQSAGRPALEFAGCRRCRRCCWPTCSRRYLARCLDPCGCCTAKTATTGTPPWSACPWRPSACCMRWRRPCCPAPPPGVSASAAAPCWACWPMAAATC